MLKNKKAGNLGETGKEQTELKNNNNFDGNSQDQIPAELKKKPQWVAWKAVPDYDKNLERKPKDRKVPINVQSGRGAQANNQNTWACFKDVADFIDEWAGQEHSHIDGKGAEITGIVSEHPGFMFHKDDGFCGIDLDNCRNPDTGEVTEAWAENIINTMDTYTEVSPSKTGFHCIIKGKKPEGSSARQGKIECYDCSRYFTVTSSTIGKSNIIESRQDELEKFIKKYLTKKKQKINGTKPDPETGQIVSSEVVLNRAIKSKNGDKIKLLLDGDDIGFPSESEADLSLCNHLVFFCGNVPDGHIYKNVDLIIQNSKRYRDKWDKVHRPEDGATYGHMTIEKAIKDTTNRYTARQEKTSIQEILQWIEDTEDTNDILKGWLDKIIGMDAPDVEAVKEAVIGKTGTKKSILNTLLREKKAEEKKEKAKARAKKNSQDRAKAGIKEILYSPTATGDCCHEISESLKNHPEQKIYRFAGNLIKITNSQPTSVRMVKKNHDGKYPSMPIITQLSPETLCHEVEKVAACQGTNKEGEIKDIPWPKNILKGVLMLTETQEKTLIGIIEHPYIDDDFQPVLNQGYDNMTGLYKVFDVKSDIDFFKTPEDALTFLVDDVFKDFPFSSTLDEMATVSCLLTGMQRKLIADDSGCPGYLFTAPVQSSGKTTLCQIINYSLYGRPAAASSYSDDDSEMSKHLLGVLQEGISSVLFDNIAEGSVIESNELAKIITSDSYKNRVLGQNKTVTVPSSVLWLMTGNNVNVCGDFNTRFLKIELNPKEVNPDQRVFKRQNIAEWCENHRGKILGACLKIIMSGKECQNPDLKSSRFKTWNKFIRNPLYKISQIDVAELFQKNKLGDPKLEGQNNFFENWFNVFGERATTAKEVLDHCRLVSESERVSGVIADSELAEAIKDIFSGGNLPTTKSLGKWLGGLKNRFFGNYKLIDGGLGTSRNQVNKALWIVKNV